MEGIYFRIAHCKTCLRFLSLNLAPTGRSFEKPSGAFYQKVEPHRWIRYYSSAMADLALYRKYRPSKFSHMVGQDHIQKTLLNAIKSGHLSHAYLFCGPRGTGKTTTARLVAKAINCIAPDPDGESCNRCDYCLAMNQGSLVDLIEIDAASNRGIDEIRDLREKIKFAPNQAPHKVYIIDEVHMLTTPAFNALLKTLEEPPKHAYFILATTESHKIPETIVSRCQRFDFRRIDSKVLIDRLKEIALLEKIEHEERALECIAQAAEGGMRDAISFFEQMIQDEQLTAKHVQDVLGLSAQGSSALLFDCLEKSEIKKALSVVQGLHREGHDLYQFNREFLEFLRTKLLESIGKDDLTKKWLLWIDIFQLSAKELKTALIPQLPLEVAVVKSCLGGPEIKETWLTGILKSKPANDSAEVKSSPKSTIAPPQTEEGLKVIPSEDQKLVPSVLSMESIKTEWPRLLENIKTPSVRQSFKTGTLAHVKEDTVHMEFQSQFHLSKVETTANKAEVESAFESLFNAKIKLSCALRKMDDLVDKTLEIFGGEMIEEEI